MLSMFSFLAVQTQDIMDALGLMGKGMLGIFVVIFLIYGIVVALTKLSERSSNKEQE